MAKTLQQTQYAIDALIKAGVPRDQFGVRSPYNRKVGGYTDTYITLYTKQAQKTAFINHAILTTEGYDVTAYYTKDETGNKRPEPSFVSVSPAANRKNPMFEERVL